MVLESDEEKASKKKTTRVKNSCGLLKSPLIIRKNLRTVAPLSPISKRGRGLSVRRNSTLRPFTPPKKKESLRKFLSLPVSFEDSCSYEEKKDVLKKLFHRTLQKTENLDESFSLPQQSPLEASRNFCVAYPSRLFVSLAAKTRLVPKQTVSVASFETNPFSVGPNSPNLKSLCVPAELQTSSVRKMPNTPYKVLEAPGISNNFYTHVLDWAANLVFVALRESVFVYDTHTGTVAAVFGAAVRDERKDYFCGSLTGCSPLVTAVKSVDGGLAVGDESGTLSVLDLEKHTETQRRNAFVSRLGCLAWDGDRVLAAGSRACSTKLFDLREAAEVAVLAAHRGEVTGLAFEGKVLASGANDDQLLVWDLAATRRCFVHYDEHRSAVRAMAFSPFRRGLLCTGGGFNDKKIRFFDVFDSSHKALFAMNTGSQVCSVLWRNCPQEVVSAHGYTGNELNVWAFPSLKRVARVAGYKSRLLHMAMAPDRLEVVTGSSDEKINFWRLDKRTKNKDKSSNLYTCLR